MNSRAAFPVCLALLALLAAPVAAQNVPTGIVVETVATWSGTGDAPYDWTELNPPTDTRKVVAHRDGGLRLVMPNGTVTTIGTIPSVQTGSERGLLSITVDPNFPASPYIYAFMSRNGQSTMRLSRWTLTGDVNNPAGSNIGLGSETIILNNIADNAFNHNGGTVRFGPDGMLFLSMGDDASCSSAQNNTDARGKLLRMDVSGIAPGAVGPISETALDPGDNPMSASAGAAQLFVAKGLRNPVTFNLDPVTGNIYIADVGQNAREEFDCWERNLGGSIVMQNFGWPIREGIAPYGGCGGGSNVGLINPIDDYAQATGGVSIMAAGFIRNTGQQYEWDSSYDGNVFHNDYYNGTIERLSGSGQSWSNVTTAGQPSPSYWGTGFQACMHFDQASDGAIYFCKHANTSGGANGGSLMRMRPDVFNHTITKISGDGQLAIIGGSFDAPCVVEVQDLANNPVVGATVNFSVTGGTLSASSAVTDAQGRAQVDVNASTTLAGPVVVTATTPMGSLAGEQFNLYTRGMRIIYNPTGILIVIMTDTPNGSPTVPYMMFAGTTPLASPLVTPYGILHLNPLDPTNALPFCDGIGLFNFVSVQNKPCTGTPNLTNIYTGANILAGTTWTFQAVGYNGNFWVSNAVTQTF